MQPFIIRFGGCLTLEYRVKTIRPSTVVSFTINGRLLIGRRSYYVRGKTIRAVDEGPYWQTAWMTIPPRPTDGPFTVSINVLLFRETLLVKFVANFVKFLKFLKTVQMAHTLVGSPHQCSHS